MVPTAYQKKKAYAMLAAGQRPVDIQKRVTISAEALYTHQSREKKRKAKLDQKMKDPITMWG